MINAAQGDSTITNDKIADYIAGYVTGKYRLVVEAVYWFGYLYADFPVEPYKMPGSDQQLMFYGTVKELAAYEN